MKKTIANRISNGLLGALALSALSSCVTVNVNFPEGAAQQATDDFVKDLYRAKEKGKSPTADASPNVAPSTSPGPSALFWIFEAPAFAADESFSVKSPASLKIRDRLRARLDDVLAAKRAGQLGETSDGKLSIRNKAPSLKPIQAKKLEQLVSDENSDRRDLYKEVLKQNSLPSTRLPSVEKSFARSFQAESPSGTWVQGDDGKWVQKP